MEQATNFRPLIAAGIFLGIGLGGFVDGILLHQILQWHSMVSHYYPKTGLPPEVIIRNMQINMFWDGLFHAATWLSTVAGVAILWMLNKNKSIGDILVEKGYLSDEDRKFLDTIVNKHISRSGSPQKSIECLQDQTRGNPAQLSGTAVTTIDDGCKKVSHQGSIRNG